MSIFPSPRRTVSSPPEMGQLGFLRLASTLVIHSSTPVTAVWGRSFFWQMEAHGAAHQASILVLLRGSGRSTQSSYKAHLLGVSAPCHLLCSSPVSGFSLSLGNDSEQTKMRVSQTSHTHTAPWGETYKHAYHNKS